MIAHRLEDEWRDEGDWFVMDRFDARWLPGGPVAICLRETIDGHIRFRWSRGDDPASCRRCATAQAIGLLLAHIREQDREVEAKERIAKERDLPATPERIDAIERARRYVATLPPSLSGSGGRNAMFHACQVLVRGFALSLEDALPLALEYDVHSAPAWGAREVRSKLRDALRRGRMEPGSLLNATRKSRAA